jgi:hypothetical protein
MNVFVGLQFLEPLRAIELCWESRLYGPVLVLMYSTIDAVAWLSCPLGQPEVKRSDFVGWVDRYLIPDSGLQCTATELYAARCGVLHSLTPDSGISRKGDARQIYYAVGPDRARVLQYAIDNSSEPIVAVQLDLLLRASRHAFTRFFESAATDEDLTRRIESRRSRIFATYTDSIPTTTTALDPP